TGAIAAGEPHLGRHGSDAYVIVAGARQGAATQPQPPADTRAPVRRRTTFRGSARCPEAGEHAGGPRLRWSPARRLEQRARAGGFLRCEGGRGSASGFGGWRIGLRLRAWRTSGAASWADCTYRKRRSAGRFRWRAASGTGEDAGYRSAGIPLRVAARGAGGRADACFPGAVALP